MTQLITMIAMLCQIHSSGSVSWTNATQAECHRYYAECLLKAKTDKQMLACVAERQKMDDWVKRRDEELKTVDLSQWMHMSSEEIQNTVLHDFFKKQPWALAEQNTVSPRGSPYFDSLMALRDEKRTLEFVIKNLNTSQGIIKFSEDDIVDVYEASTQMAECGCCVESGGEFHVTLSSGSKVVLNRYGIVQDEEKPQGFKWLRKIKK